MSMSYMNLKKKQCMYILTERHSICQRKVIQNYQVNDAYERMEKDRNSKEMAKKTYVRNWQEVVI